MAIEIWAIWLIAAFFSGSIPFAVILGKLNGVDIRKMGSGNPGASNLGRQVGKKWGVLCFFLDVGKGLLPTLGFAAYTVYWWTQQDVSRVELIWGPIGSTQAYENSSYVAGAWDAVQWVFVAITAVLGHIFSPFLKFKGGKGVATGLGSTLGLFPVVTVPAALAFAVWYAVCKVSGYVGLASVVAAASLPVLTVAAGVVLQLSGGEIAVFAGLTALLAAVVIVRHRGNLARIRAGIEPKAAWTGRA